jgi:VWFA-related protein
MMSINRGGARFLLALLLSAAAYGQLTVPRRPSTSLFKGQQGKQNTEIAWDPSTDTVRLEFVVQDTNGYFIPGIRRENFAVYENGVRQTNATVDVEHAPVSIGLLMEYGGRQSIFNKDFFADISRADRQVVEALARNDRVAIWAYGDKVRQLADFSPPGERLDSLLLELMPPDLSETNLYDALVFALNRMRDVPKRKAIVLISSGVDTFSKANLETVKSAAEHSPAPVYVIGLGRVARLIADTLGENHPMSRVDWKSVEHNMEEIARVSGGRFYNPESTIQLPSVVDDLTQSVKVRYVITYRPSNPGIKGVRTVRVELVDPKTGGPLRISDENGNKVVAAPISEASYTPGK